MQREEEETQECKGLLGFSFVVRISRGYFLDARCECVSSASVIINPRFASLALRCFT